MKLVTFNGQTTPAYLASGNMQRFIAPVALEMCKGYGYDIGCNRAEWSLPGSIPFDPNIDKAHDATQLGVRDGMLSYVFSSHCLEHVPNYVSVLRHWVAKLRSGGVLFLYLPHPDCQYWRPHLMPTQRHIHLFSPDLMEEVLTSIGLVNVFVTERDAAWSFAVWGEKP